MGAGDDVRSDYVMFISPRVVFVMSQAGALVRNAEAEKEFTFSGRLREITSFSRSHRFELLVHTLARNGSSFPLLVRRFHMV